MLVNRKQRCYLVDRIKFNNIPQVARESGLRFNPHAKIEAHHANVKSHDFGPEYFKRFGLVMNALDNLGINSFCRYVHAYIFTDARRHVNRMCLAANVPLIESGTEGYLGQVTVIHKVLILPFTFSC